MLPILSDMPQRITMARATAETFWISPEAPEDTRSSPHFLISAALPAMPMAIRSFIWSLCQE